MTEREFVYFAHTTRGFGRGGGMTLVEYIRDAARRAASGELHETAEMLVDLSALTRDLHESTKRL